MGNHSGVVVRDQLSVVSGQWPADSDNQNPSQPISLIRPERPQLTRPALIDQPGATFQGLKAGVGTQLVPGWVGLEVDDPRFAVSVSVLQIGERALRVA